MKAALVCVVVLACLAGIHAQSGSKPEVVQLFNVPKLTGDSIKLTLPELPKVNLTMPSLNLNALMPPAGKAPTMSFSNVWQRFRSWLGIKDNKVTPDQIKSALVLAWLRDSGYYGLADLAKTLNGTGVTLNDFFKSMNLTLVTAPQAANMTELWLARMGELEKLKDKLQLPGLPKASPKPVAKPVAPKASSKPAAKPSSKPAPKSSPKPAPRPAPKPSPKPKVAATTTKPRPSPKPQVAAAAKA